jgi:hypothetical protein
MSKAELLQEIIDARLTKEETKELIGYVEALIEKKGGEQQ